ncbi:MAG: enoyl-CoA hydratase/isomerase family protein [Acidobacteriota bacterium]
MIRSEQDGRARRITLAAPETRNILNFAFADLFLTELIDAEEDPDTAAILIDAEGPVFCGGMDFTDPPPTAIFNFGERATKPVIVAMQGVALSVGVVLLANAHIVVAAQGSSFGLTDLREGRCDQRVQAAVARVLGQRRTLELALTGRVFTTPDALNWGLAHAAVPAFELDDRALAVVQGVAGANREAVKAILRLPPQGAD